MLQVNSSYRPHSNEGVPKGDAPSLKGSKPQGPLSMASCNTRVAANPPTQPLPIQPNHSFFLHRANIHLQAKTYTIQKMAISGWLVDIANCRGRSIKYGLLSLVASLKWRFQTHVPHMTRASQELSWTIPNTQTSVHASGVTENFQMALNMAASWKLSFDTCTEVRASETFISDHCDPVSDLTASKVGS